MLIQRALQQVLQGRTSIVIAHRLSTVRNADKIIVLNRGRLVEMGNHEELLALGGVYERLYAVNYGLISEPLATIESNGGGNGAEALAGGGMAPVPADD